MEHISRQLIDDCLKPKVWDLGNETLYRLCENHFDHSSAEKIIAKTWLIGRSYSVSLERVREKKKISDNFYTDFVVPHFKNSELDNLLNTVKYLPCSVENSFEILNVHNSLTKLINVFTEMNKRSFASKYLHFHLPVTFFIYDTRAVQALKKFVPALPDDLKGYSKNFNFDKKYTDFYFRCLHLQKRIATEQKIILSPREIDNLLLEYSNKLTNNSSKTR